MIHFLSPILPPGDSTSTAWNIPGRAGMFPYRPRSGNFHRRSREKWASHGTMNRANNVFWPPCFCRLFFHHRQTSHRVAGLRPRNLGRLGRHFMDQLPERRPDRDVGKIIAGVGSRSERRKYWWDAQTLPSLNCKFCHFLSSIDLLFVLNKLRSPHLRIFGICDYAK